MLFREAFVCTVDVGFSRWWIFAFVSTADIRNLYTSCSYFCLSSYVFSRSVNCWCGGLFSWRVNARANSGIHICEFHLLLLHWEYTFLFFASSNIPFSPWRLIFSVSWIHIWYSKIIDFFVHVFVQEGKTALDQAKERGKHDIVHLLEVRVE